MGAAGFLESAGTLWYAASFFEMKPGVPWRVVLRLERK